MLQLEKELFFDQPSKVSEESNERAKAIIPQAMQEFLAQAAPYSWTITDDSFYGPFKEIQFHFPEELVLHRGRKYIDIVADLKNYGGMGLFCYYPKYRKYGVYDGGDNYKYVFLNFDQQHFEEHFPWYFAAQWAPTKIRKEFGITLVPDFFLDKYTLHLSIGDYKKKAIFSEELSGQGIDVALDQGEYKRWKKKKWIEESSWREMVYKSPVTGLEIPGKVGVLKEELQLSLIKKQVYNGEKQQYIAVQVFVPDFPYWSSPIIFGLDLLNKKPNWRYNYCMGEILFS